MIDILLAHLYWDPSRVFFVIPLVNRPIMWYGVCFVIGLVMAYLLLIRMMQRKICYSLPLPNEQETKELSVHLTDRLTWLVVGGILIGARLGQVFFYDWPYMREHPLDIIKIWEGGLASHGGALGIIVAVMLFAKFYAKKLYPSPVGITLSFLITIDLIAVVTPLVGCCIRIGNFINQEIIGTATTLPWGVIFGHPMEAAPLIPRHPVQLYEAFAYLLTFLLLFWYWKKGEEQLYSNQIETCNLDPAKAPGVDEPKRVNINIVESRELSSVSKSQFQPGCGIKPGALFGLCLICIFSARMICEYFKLPQGGFLDESFFSTGQALSIPFILAGIALLFRPCSYKRTEPFKL